MKQSSTMTLGPDRESYVSLAFWATLYGRVAVGSAFLSAVAGRFGIWHCTIGTKYFKGFLEYTAEVVSYVPASWIPTIGWSATIAETSIGILLIAGVWPRWVSLAAAILLALFGTSMAISQGLKSPMDYSVYSASSAALLLALRAFEAKRPKSGHERQQ